MENKLSRDAMKQELLTAFKELTDDEQDLLLSMLEQSILEAAG